MSHLHETALYIPSVLKSGLRRGRLLGDLNLQPKQAVHLES